MIWHNRTLRALVWGIGLWQIFRHAFLAMQYGARAARPRIDCAVILPMSAHFPVDSA